MAGPATRELSTSPHSVSEPKQTNKHTPSHARLVVPMARTSSSVGAHLRSSSTISSCASLPGIQWPMAIQYNTRVSYADEWYDVESCVHACTRACCVCVCVYACVRFVLCVCTCWGTA